MLDISKRINLLKLFVVFSGIAGNVSVQFCTFIYYLHLCKIVKWRFKILKCGKVVYILT